MGGPGATLGRPGSPRGRGLPGAGLAGLLLLGGLVAGGAARGDEAPFEVRTLESRGRPLDAVPREGGELVVAFVEGVAPDERRHLDVFRTAGDGGSAPRLRVVVPAEAVAFDVADVDPLPGEELLLFARRGIEVMAVGGGEARVLRRIALDPPAPLPPRTREFSRLPVVADWTGSGRPQAMLPSLDGARLLDLDTGLSQTLPVPILNEYYTPQEGPPPYDGLLEVILEWPRLVRGDDDGDGRAEIFALGRYGVSVFAVGPDGRVAGPTRSMPLRPFPAEDELRHEATQVRLFAEDLDGDGLVDLVVHRASGRLLSSYAVTEVHRNRGRGADLARPADAVLEVRPGVSGVRLVDIDGDGRREVLHSVVRFGLVQLLRALTTRRAEVEISVQRFAQPGLAGLAEAWSSDVSLRLDFEQARSEGLLPSADGDWNGDGRRDLVYGTARTEIGVHLGEAKEDGPGFGGRVAEQTVPAASHHRVTDLDGDGLDDLVIWDELDPAGAVHLLRNRGVLPGTRAGIRAAD